MIAKKLALVFGIIFIAIGVLGFVPGITVEGDDGHQMLLGIFGVDLMHNIVHILSGLVALMVAMNEEYSLWYFKIFGAVYGLVTVIGFVQGNTILGLFYVDMADNFLHLAIAAVSLAIGFGVKPSQPQVNSGNTPVAM